MQDVNYTRLFPPREGMPSLNNAYRKTEKLIQSFGKKINKGLYFFQIKAE